MTKIKISAANRNSNRRKGCLGFMVRGLGDLSNIHGGLIVIALASKAKQIASPNLTRMAVEKRWKRWMGNSRKLVEAIGVGLVVSC